MRGQRPALGGIVGRRLSGKIVRVPGRGDDVRRRMGHGIGAGGVLLVGDGRQAVGVEGLRGRRWRRRVVVVVVGVEERRGGRVVIDNVRAMVQVAQVGRSGRGCVGGGRYGC